MVSGDPRRWTSSRRSCGPAGAALAGPGERLRRALRRRWRSWPRSLARELAPVRPAAGQVPLFSTVAGGGRRDRAGRRVLVRQPAAARSGSTTSVRALAAAGYRAFVEVSPHPVLTAAVTETVEDAGRAAGAVVTGTLDRDDGGAGRLLAALARVHVRGPAVDWAAVLGRRAAGRPAHLRLPAPALLAARRSAAPRRTATGPGRPVEPRAGGDRACRGLPVGRSPAPRRVAGSRHVAGRSVPAGVRTSGARPDRRALRAAGRPAARRDGGASRSCRRGRWTGPALAEPGSAQDAGRPVSRGVVSLLALDEAPLRRLPGGARPGWPGRWRWCRRWATPGSARRCGC